MMNKIFFIFFSFFLIGCTSKQLSSQTALIILKTKEFKFYDKGFITKYTNRINLTIFSFGQVALKLDVYPDKVCESTLRCLDTEEFNAKYLSKSYKKDFLYKLLQKNVINFQDKENNIRIKVNYEE